LKYSKDWRAKASAIEALEENLKASNSSLGNLETDELFEFLSLILDLTTDANFKV